MQFKISLLFVTIIFKVGFTTGNPFDLILIVDEGRHMKGVHDSIKANINFMFDELHRNAPGSRIGLVGFGNGPPIPGIHNFLEDTAHVHSVLTSDRNVFAAGANTLNSNYGLNKPTFKAIPSVTETIAVGGLDMGYEDEPNRPFCVALFTYEDTNGGFQQRAIDYMLNRPGAPNQSNVPGAFYAVLPGGADHYNQYTPITSATRGDILSINDPRFDRMISVLISRCLSYNCGISMTPFSAVLSLGIDHTLTIVKTIFPQSFTLTILDGPDKGMTYSLVADRSKATITHLYNPLERNPLYDGGKINFQVCVENTINCAYTSADFQNPLCANVDCSSLDTDCEMGICDPTNGQCILQNKADGTLCTTDGLLCTFDTCQNGKCVSDTVELEEADVVYTQGTIQANFNTNKEVDSVVTMEFEYLGTGSGVFLTTYEAIIYDDSLCEGNIVGKTDGAKYDTDIPVIDPPIYLLNIAGTAVFPKLLITPDFNNEEITDFFDFFAECENDSQEINENVDVFQQNCIEMEFCIEFQTLVCDEVKSSVKVNVLANLAVDRAECENDECEFNVAFKRDAPVLESFSTSIDFQIGSYPCDEFGTPSAATFTQGDPVTACLQIEGNTAGVCFLDVVNMDMNVQQSESVVSEYGIIPQGPPPDNLFWADDNNPTPIGSDGKALSVKFIPPPEEIQNIASDDTLMANFDVAVNIGLGCYCDGTCNKNAPRRFVRRSLQQQQTDKSYVLKSPGKEFEVKLYKGLVPPASLECNGLFDTGLPWFGNFCPLKALFAWIESLFSFLRV